MGAEGAPAVDQPTNHSHTEITRNERLSVSTEILEVYWVR